MTKIISANDEAIVQAARVLKSGGLVGLPTETVYGLAGNAFDDKAVAKIYEAKGRPSFNPLIVHYPSAPDIDQEWYQILAAKFWPGPLTMVVPQYDERISQLARAGLETVAIRVPSHPVAQKLLKQIDFPLVAPSANISGSLSPTTPTHVAEGLGDKVDLILAAGACAVGVESTVVDLSGDHPVILRPGAITAEDISDALGFKVGYDLEASDTPRAPGQLLKHYAPNTPVRLKAIDIEKDEALLAFGSIKFMGVKGGGAAKDLPEEQMLNLSEQGDLHEAAANLFAMLKMLDKGGFKRIAVMNIPETGLGIAINDRLKRAAS